MSQSVRSLSNFQAICLVMSVLLFTATGATIMTGGGTHIVAYCSILLIAILPILIVAEVIPKKVWPLTVYIIGIASLWQTTLVTNHLWSWDIHFMYNVSQDILHTNQINLQDSAGHGSLVSPTWFASMVHLITGIEVVYVYKVIFPLIAAVIPLILYTTGRKIHPGKSAAVLAPLAFVFFYRYYKAIPGKQVFGQLFIASIILWTLIGYNKNRSGRRTIPFIFGTALVFSHHTSGIIFLLLSVSAVGLTSVLHGDNWKATILDSSASAVPLVVGIIWYSWYSQVIEGDVIVSAVLAGVKSIFQISGLFGLNSTPGTTGAARTGGGYLAVILNDPILVVSALLTALVICLAYIGTSVHVYKKTKQRDTLHIHDGFLLSGMGIGIIGVVASLGIGFDRLVSYVLLIISPMVVLGSITSTKAVGLIKNIDDPYTRGVQISILLLCLLFLFGTGLAFVPFGDPPQYALGVEDESYWQRYSNEEVSASRWMSESTDGPVTVYANPYIINQRDGLLISELYDPDEIIRVQPNTTVAPKDCTVMYFSDRPWRTGNGPDGWFIPQESQFHSAVLTTESKLFHSGKSQIYSCS